MPNNNYVKFIIMLGKYYYFLTMSFVGIFVTDLVPKVYFIIKIIMTIPKCVCLFVILVKFHTESAKIALVTS